MTIHEKTLQQIDQFIAMDGRKDLYGTDDLAVLTYIRDNITPEAIEERAAAELGNVNHLLEAAKIRLTPYQEVLASA